jgi:hypothetical protein
MGPAGLLDREMQNDDEPRSIGRRADAAIVVRLAGALNEMPHFGGQSFASDIEM